MSIQQDQRNEWKTDAAFLGDDSPHDSIGVCLSADIEDGVVREGYVTLFADTPEFPQDDDPSTFETTNVHLTPARARKLSARLAALADVMERNLAHAASSSPT
jgi:hypothetical protein